MSYEMPSGGNRHRGVARGGSARDTLGAGYASESRRQRINAGGGNYHGPQGLQSRSGGRGRGRGGSVRNIGRGGQGYPLRSRNINFGGGRRMGGFDRRLLILGAAALLVVILLVVGVSSCVRGCSSNTASSSDQQSVNETDSRVAAGVSEELTTKLASELDRGEKMQQIAANADKYTDDALIDLAIAEPAAVDFVAAYPDAEKTSGTYTGSVEKGTIPQLWCWDSAWGNMDYAGHALAVSGSGPVSLSMAVMGLTGDTSFTASKIASMVTADGLATGDSYMSGEFVTKEADGLGITVKQLTATSDNVNTAVDPGSSSYALIEVAADTLTESAHWVLVVGENQDGTVMVFDPTSTDASSHAWSPATLVSGADSIYQVSVKETSTE